MTTEELYEDMKQDSYNEARKEAMLRKDYNAFLEHFSFEIEEATQAIKELRDAHRKYNWEFDANDWM